MLSTEIASTSELISITLAAERMAIQRYAKLASRMREHGNDGSADVFESLVIGLCCGCHQIPHCGFADQARHEI